MLPPRRFPARPRPRPRRRVGLPGALAFVLMGATGLPAAAELKVGAAITDVSPPQFPVLVNGGFLSRTASEIRTPVQARAIVVDDGQERIAIVVVDSCMMPRPLLDDAKRLAARRTEIAADRMLISATHTHSAPSCMGALGTDADPAYVSFLREKLAEAIATAERHLEPAVVGWGAAPADKFTAIRRWIRRSDRVDNDPFGNPTVRANMHAANRPDDVTGPSGPEDPELSVISFRSADGRPLAALVNFSMHYFGDQPISADYFGLFCGHLERHFSGGQVSDDPVSDGPVSEVRPDRPPFVAVMSHGCSGDIWRRDYAIPPEQRWDPSIDEYSRELADVAIDAVASIADHADADLAMAERRMRLRYRVPDRQRLQWAERIVEAMGDRLPENSEEVMAREQLILHQWQDTEIVVQAVRIGEIAIATTPNETYALTGLKLKAQSPLPQTMVIELANGGDGYIPPPEQHVLGGYNTWAARSAGLEVLAEPKIVAAAAELLEQVSGKGRRIPRPELGPAGRRLVADSPLAYWRLDDFAGPIATDHGGQGRHAVYEPGVVFFLDGDDRDDWGSPGETNRAAHFAGGRLLARLDSLGTEYSVSFSFWNGVPVDGRETTGWLFSRDHPDGFSRHGDHLGISGTDGRPGRLMFRRGQNPPLIGHTDVGRWRWNRVTLTRRGDQVQVFLNDQPTPEIRWTDTDPPPEMPTLFFGGRSDRIDGFEGRLDEIVVRGPTPEVSESGDR